MFNSLDKTSRSRSSYSYAYKRAWNNNPTTPATAPPTPRSSTTALATLLDVAVALDATLEAELLAADADDPPDDVILAADEAAELPTAAVPVLEAADPDGVAKGFINIVSFVRDVSMLTGPDILHEREWTAAQSLLPASQVAGTSIGTSCCLHDTSITCQSRVDIAIDGRIRSYQRVVGTRCVEWARPGCWTALNVVATCGHGLRVATRACIGICNENMSKLPVMRVSNHLHPPS